MNHNILRSAASIFFFFLLPVIYPGWFSLQGQDNPPDSLTYYADVMRNTQIAEHRSFAAEKFKQAFIKELETQGSFYNAFPKLEQWISFRYPQDSSFRVVTWQVDGKSTYRYEGVIQRQSGEMIVLNDISANLNDIEYDVLSPDSWYGALYYDMVRLDSNTYLLLGFNAVDDQTSSKVAEILRFDQKGISLGHEVFYMDRDSVRPNVKTRIILNYSELAAVRLTYDDSVNLLFFDNLIPVESYEKDGATVWVQDGSYSGFELVNGRLYYIDKVFDTKVDEPPRERPVDEEKKDILGRPSKG